MELLSRFGPAKKGEERTLAFALLAFFLVFTAWYMIRPVREALGIARGAGDLPWLMVGTVIATLIANPIFAKLTTRATRATMARRVYRFLALNLVAFYLALVVFPDELGIDANVRLWIGYGLFIWVSIFSLLIGSLLWSICSEIFTPEAAGRLFGLLAGACSLGGLIGATATSYLAGQFDDPLHVLILAALLLEGAARAAQRIPGHGNAPKKPARTEANAAATERGGEEEEPLKGSAFEGLVLTLRSPYLLGISGYILAYTLVGTLAYLIQGAVIDALGADLSGDIQRFAWIDQLTNGGTLLVQLFALRRLVARFGVGPWLAALPAVFLIGFGCLWAFPVYGVLAAFQVIRRVTNYGLAKPAREMLFTPLERSEKYKAKNLIDLFVYRTGDTLGSLAHVGLSALGLGIAGIAGIAVPISGLWLLLTPLLGRAFDRKLPPERGTPGDAASPVRDESDP